jgi:hypothetical protein
MKCNHNSLIENAINTLGQTDSLMSEQTKEQTKNRYGIYLFVCYLMTVLVHQIIQRPLTIRLMNNELKRMWKEAVLTY